MSRQTALRDRRTARRLTQRAARRRTLTMESLETRRVLAAVFTADFTDASGFGENEGFSTSGPANEWHLSTGRGNEAGHSPDSSFYFGSGENAFGGGTYGAEADGTLMSPPIDLITAPSATLTFNHFLAVEGAPFDLATVSIVASSGTTVIGTSGTEFPNSTPGFVSASFDLTPFVGESIQIAFRLTSDNVVQDEGWYVDDVVVDVPLPPNPNALDFSDAGGAPDAEGFTTSGPADEWHLSTRRGADPGHSADDSFYFGNELGGEYASNADGTLTSPSFDMTGATAPMLTFRHFLETEPGFDTATVSIIHSSGTDVIATSGSELPNETTGFVEASLDLSSYVGDSIQVAFQFQSDGSVEFEGWYIDDFFIEGLATPTAEDFGDAPSIYPTSLADDGPRHVAVGPRLGPTRDTEDDGQASFLADGDGLDEDGVMFGGIGYNDTTAAVNLLLENAATAQVDAWIDFNLDGDFNDPGEKILDDVTISNPMQTLNYNLPAGQLPFIDTYARVRLSSAGGLAATGPAADGEVEDYRVHIITPPKVSSFVINGGDPQRSTIRELQVNFNSIVEVDQSGGPVFDVFNETTNEAVEVVAVFGATLTGTTADLTFLPGPSVNANGGLLDGNYSLTIDPNLVTLLGVKLDGDGNNVSGFPYLDSFYRKYGDQDGSGLVTLIDFAQFRQAFGTSTGDTAYQAGMDADSDGTIGLIDFAVFRQNFGT